MTNINLSTPVNGTVVDAVLHTNNYTEIETAINGGLDAGNLAPGAAILDSQLASANNGVYGLLDQATQYVLGGDTNGTYVVFEDAHPNSGSGTGAPAHLIYLTGDDYAVASKTAVLNLDVTLMVNGTAPACTVTFGFYPVTSVAGGAAASRVTLGALTPSSSVAFAAPALGTTNHGTSGDFAFPSDGYYAFGFVITGGPVVANSYVPFTCRLRVRNV